MKEKKQQNNVISRQFTTMLTLDVLADLTIFAKQYAGTGLGKFDFGVALRILLDRSDYLSKVEELEDRLTILEEHINKESKQNKPDTVNTFGK